MIKNFFISPPLRSVNHMIIEIERYFNKASFFVMVIEIGCLE